MSAKIRAATLDDALAIKRQWNQIIEHTDITFNSTPKTLESVTEFLTTHEAENDPVLVLDIDGEVLGYAAYHPFRPGPGYGLVREVSITLDPKARRDGHGRNMMQALEEIAKPAGLHVFVAGITASNIASLKFFAGLGYAQVGRMPEVGYKFERHHDLVLMQKFL